MLLLDKQQQQLLESSRLHFEGVKSREIRLSTTTTTTASAKPPKVCRLAWSCDGKRLAASSSDGIIRLWTGLGSGTNSPSSSEISVIAESSSSSSSSNLMALLAFHPVNSELLVCVCNSALVLIDVSKNSIHQRLDITSHSSSIIINMAWNLGGARLLLGTKDDTLLCYTMGNNGLMTGLAWSFKCPWEANQFVSIDDSSLLIASSPGSISLLKLNNNHHQHHDHHPTVARSIRIATATAYSLAHSKDRLAVGNGDATITILDYTTLFPLFTISRPEWPVRLLAFSHDGAFLAAGSDDRHIDISDSGTGLCVHRVPVNAPVSALEWHPAAYLLAYACDEVDRNGRPDFVVRIFGFNN